MMTPTRAITLTLASFLLWLLALLAEPTLELALMVLLIVALSVVYVAACQVGGYLSGSRQEGESK